MPRLTAATRSARRRTLIGAGRRCLATSGYRDLRVADVCREANVSKGAFYGYFPHKRSLLLALLQDDAERADQLMVQLERSQSDAGQRLRAFAAAMLRSAQEPGRLQMTADLWAAMSTDPAVRDTLARATARRRRRLCGWVEHGISRQQLVSAPANALASLLLALSDGLILHAGLDAEAFRWENIGVTIDLLLSALRAA